MMIQKGYFSEIFCAFFTIFLQQLINANCDLNIQNNNGWTALYCALKKWYDKISQQLIHAKCDLNIQDNNGWTALGYDKFEYS